MRSWGCCTVGGIAYNTNAIAVAHPRRTLSQAVLPKTHPSCVTFNAVSSIAYSTIGGAFAASSIDKMWKCSRTGSVAKIVKSSIDILP